jgi:hypothetical protein
MRYPDLLDPGPDGSNAMASILIRATVQRTSLAHDLAMMPSWHHMPDANDPSGVSTDSRGWARDSAALNPVQ